MYTALLLYHVLYLSHTVFNLLLKLKTDISIQMGHIHTYYKELNKMKNYRATRYEAFMKQLYKLIHLQFITYII